MFDLAKRLADRLSNMLGPFPAGLISRSADRHSADIHDFESAKLE
jgi:hypothetical protein